MSLDVQNFKNIMSHWTTGISVITTAHEEEWQGFTANSFASVSIDPMLISMSVSKTLYAGQLILKSGVFAVNILTRDQGNWSKLFAGMYPDRKNRFENIICTPAANGSPILPGVLGWLGCRVYQSIDVGASILILGEITEGDLSEDGEPLVYYHRQWGYFAQFADS